MKARMFEGDNTIVSRETDAVGRPQFRIVTADGALVMTNEQAHEALIGLATVGWGGAL